MKGLARKWILHWVSYFILGKLLWEGPFQERIYLFSSHFIFWRGLPVQSSERISALLPVLFQWLCVYFQIPFESSISFSLTSIIILSETAFIFTLSFSQDSLIWGWKAEASMLWRSFSCGCNLFLALSMTAVTI